MEGASSPLNYNNMRKLWRSAILSILIISAYVAGRWHVRHAEPTNRVTASAGYGARRVLYYHCPMHPEYHSERQGDAPCCGMRLEPVYADNNGPEAPPLPPGVFRVSPQKQQLAGVRFVPVENIHAEQIIRAAGKVAYDQQETVIIADVYEYESTALRLGQRAWVSRPYPPRRAFWATLDYLYPRLDPGSRTLKVRLNAGDVGVKFIPDTFMDVEFRVPGGPAQVVPSEAVLNTGRRKVVYRDLGEGLIEAVEVETGRRFRDRIEILHGLGARDRVAVSGVFLLDSESRIVLADAGRPSKILAAAGTPSGIDQPSNAPLRDESGTVTASNPLQTPATTQTDPICGMFVDTLTAGLRKSEFNGRTYYFCSTSCKRKFDENPSAGGGMAKPSAPADIGQPHTHQGPTRAPDQPWDVPEVTNSDPSRRPRDPVCGKPVDEKAAWVQVGYGRRLVREYEGQLVYFCSIECKREFDNNPAVYATRPVERETVKPGPQRD